MFPSNNTQCHDNNNTTYSTIQQVRIIIKLLNSNTINLIIISYYTVSTIFCIINLLTIHIHFILIVTISINS